MANQILPNVLLAFCTNNLLVKGSEGSQSAYPAKVCTETEASIPLQVVHHPGTQPQCASLLRYWFWTYQPAAWKCFKDGSKSPKSLVFMAKKTGAEHCREVHFENVTHLCLWIDSFCRPFLQMGFCPVRQVLGGYWSQRGALASESLLSMWQLTVGITA